MLQGRQSPKGPYCNSRGWITPRRRGRAPWVGCGRHAAADLCPTKTATSATVLTPAPPSLAQNAENRQDRQRKNMAVLTRIPPHGPKPILPAGAGAARFWRCAGSRMPGRDRHCIPAAPRGRVGPCLLAEHAIWELADGRLCAGYPARLDREKRMARFHLRQTVTAGQKPGYGRSSGRAWHKLFGKMVLVPLIGRYVSRHKWHYLCIRPGDLGRKKRGGAVLDSAALSEARGAFLTAPPTKGEPDGALLIRKMEKIYIRCRNERAVVVGRGRVRIKCEMGTMWVIS